MNTSLPVKLFKLAMLLLIVGAVIASAPSWAGIDGATTVVCPSVPGLQPR